MTSETLKALIRRALFEEWDPIGVKAIPGAEDEYDSYIPEIYRLLLERKGKDEIFAYLWRLETEHMGLTGDRQATKRFAELLKKLAAKL